MSVPSGCGLFTGTQASSQVGSSKLTQCHYRENANEREISHLPEKPLQRETAAPSVKRQHQGLVPGLSHDAPAMHGIAWIGIYTGITLTQAHHAAVKQRPN